MQSISEWSVIRKLNLNKSAPNDLKTKKVHLIGELDIKQFDHVPDHVIFGEILITLRGSCVYVQCVVLKTLKKKTVYLE